MASWSLRAAFACGKISFEGVMRMLGGSVPLRDVRSDPFLSLIAAVNTTDERAEDERLMLLSDAYQNSERLFDDVVAGSVIDDPALNELEQSLWRVLIRMLASRATGDWLEHSTTVTECRLLLAEASKVKLAGLTPLVAMLSSEVELSLALMGEPTHIPSGSHLRAMEGSVGPDAASLLGNVALAASIRGNHREAIALLSHADAEVEEARTVMLARALISLDQHDEARLRAALDAEHRPSMLGAHLNDLEVYVRARAAYLRGEDAAFRHRLSSIHVHRAAPWVADEVEGLRSELSVTEQRVRRTDDASERYRLGVAQRGPAVRLAAAKARISSGHVEAALQIVESIWRADDTFARYRGRAYSIGAHCALVLGNTQLYEELIQELHWISNEHQLLEPFEEFPAAMSEELTSSAGTQRSRTRPPSPRPEARLDLTPREMTVLEMLEAHASAADIAARLFVSANTVKTQLRHIYRKLKVHSRAEALRAAMDAGLL